MKIMVIVLRNKLLHKIKEEFKHLGIVFIVLFVLFKIAFSKEDMFTVLKFLLSFFWMFVIPGFYLMYYWHDKLGFLERFFLGTILGSAVFGTISYYLGLIGFHVTYHGFYLPLLMLSAAFFILWKKK